MAEAPQFSPEELDRLEDALESVEDTDLDLIEDESEPVKARLVEYHQILALSREALPMEDVPTGTLDRVLELARNPAAEDALGLGAARAAPSGTSWWSRFRKTLVIPALAVAGSAALILIIVQPSADTPSISADQTVARAEPTADADRSASRPTTPPAAVAPAAGEAAPQADPVPSAPPQQELAEDEGEYKEIATSKISGKPQGAAATGDTVAGKAAEQPVAEPEKAKSETAQTPRWDLIAQGDRARTEGDCATARRHYESGLSDSDDRVQARANAGLGLCEAQRGRQSAADELYERAKDLDPEISAFLNQQSPPGAEAPAKPRPNKKARKKSKRSASPDEMFDAFN